LYLRYDWRTGGGFFAKRGFVLSLYLFVIMLPTVYYLARRTLHNDRVAALLTAAVFVVFTLPYKLLGLDSLYRYRVRPEAFIPPKSFAQPSPDFVHVNSPAPSLQFLPGGALRTFPFYWLFVPLLFAFGSACVWGVWRLRARAGFRSARTVPWLLTVAFAVISLQSFLHSGMRAPYTYLSYFQAPKAQQLWYVVYHFADGSGATEGDQYVYSAIEDYFQGAPRSGNNTLIRRPFSFYLTSQVSYFVNDFYVWLALNCLFWLVAVFATARFVGGLTTPRGGLIAGALVVVGPGFIAFVATPSMYMQNYAAAAVALCAFQDLVVDPSDRGPPRFALFAGILTLCALVYDLEPLFLVLLVYGLARGVAWRPLLAALALAFVLFEGFTFMVTHVLDIAIVGANPEQLTNGLRATVHLITHPSLSRWNDTFVSVVPSFLRMWFQAFFVIPAIIAVLGLWLLRDRPVQILVGALFAAGFLIIAVLQIGGLLIGTAPRLIYPTFIGVYLPAAVALDAVAARARSVGANRVVVRRAMLATPWIVIALMALLVNVDLFGYPTQYVEYFVSKPPAFLPR
jgi:hypothetical protein